MKQVRWIAVAALALLATATSAQESAEKVIACLRANVPETVRVDELEFTVADREDSTHTLKGKLYALHEMPKPGAGFMHAMLRIDDPPQLKGAAYLIRETDDYLRDGMFVYLPSVRRVRRVTGTFADGAMLGTSFSYFDFKQMAGAFGDLVPSLEKPEEIEGRPQYVLSFKAMPGADTQYSGVRAWIDQKTCVALKAEFLQNDVVRKRYTGSAARLTQSNRYWFLSEAEMRDLQDDSRTVVRMNKVTSGAPLPGRYFDATSFYLGN